MTTMDLLERYLQAVGQYLPEGTRADTLAELRANLLESMDARAEELGRPLEVADVAAILKEHGKPEVVALRYLPQQSLVGPTIFPFYKFTMVRVVPLVVFVSLIANGINVVTSSHQAWAHVLVNFALGVCSSLLITVALITLVFATIERVVQQGEFAAKWNKWDPLKLPAVKTQDGTANTSPKSVFKRVLELVVHCLWMAFALWVPWHPFWIIGPGLFFLRSLNVAFAPVWHTFYALLIVLLVVQLVAKLLAFVPRAQSRLVPLKVVGDLLGLVAVGILAAASTYFVANGAGADAAQIAEVNHAVELAFRILFVISAVGVLKDIRRYVKRARPVRQLAF